MRRFRLSKAAEQDIQRIAEIGIALFGEEQALRYHRELFDIFALIVANPRLARERSEITPPVRIHPHKAHLIIYVIEDDNTIVIVRVRHAHEDWNQAM